MNRFLMMSLALIAYSYLSLPLVLTRILPLIPIPNRPLQMLNNHLNVILIWLSFKITN